MFKKTTSKSHDKQATNVPAWELLWKSLHSACFEASGPGQAIWMPISSGRSAFFVLWVFASAMCWVTYGYDKPCINDERTLVKYRNIILATLCSELIADGCQCVDAECFGRPINISVIIRVVLLINWAGWLRCGCSAIHTEKVSPSMDSNQQTQPGKAISWLQSYMFAVDEQLKVARVVFVVCCRNGNPINYGLGISHTQSWCCVLRWLFCGVETLNSQLIVLGASWLDTSLGALDFRVFFFCGWKKGRTLIALPLKWMRI